MSDTAPNVLYLLLLLVLVGSSLVSMRLPIAKVAKMALAWVAIFGAGFILFAFRDDFSALGQKIRAEATGTPISAGGELRIPVSEDGHFWVDGEINGHSARFLVDSGASVTTVSASTARTIGLEPDMRVAMVETANGVVPMRSARAESLEIGSIRRSDMAVNISPRDGINVLGMNFLRSLNGWRVEGHYLVLQS